MMFCFFFKKKKQYLHTVLKFVDKLFTLSSHYVWVYFDILLQQWPYNYKYLH